MSTTASNLWYLDGVLEDARDSPCGSVAILVSRSKNTKPLIVVVEDDRRQRVLFERWLEKADYATEGFENGESCLSGLRELLADAVVLDLQMPGMGGQKTLERLKAHHPQLPVIILTAVADVEQVVTTIKAGAYDYLVKPVDRTKLLTTIRNALEKNQMALRLTQLERTVEGAGYREIIGDSPAMQRVFRALDRAAPSDVTVLIYGESGTGKELVAHALHHHSGWKDGPFVAINCAAIPESLQESELFGHEKGAFTGAVTQNIGRFEQAHHGTLLLDEVAELSPSLQAKLLRVLQERVIRRLGGQRDIPSNFRLVAATHRDLDEEVKAGRFREDLFFRIAVFDLNLPPLRDRKEDIPALVAKFLSDLGADGHVSRVSPEAMEVFMAHRWPGNVRELENALQRAVVVANDGVIRPDDLPARILTPKDGEPASRERTEIRAAPLLDHVEKRTIEEALDRTGGNLAGAARQLGIARATLYRKLKKYGLRS